MIFHRWKRSGSFWLLILAALALALALLRPTLRLPQPVYRYVFVVDITQSMNVRDYHVKDLPADRLSFTKAALHKVLEDLPCGSEAGLGLFTTQNVQLLFEPIEICEHLSVINDVLAHIDWRMAWAANSHIAQGLYAGIRETQKLGDETRLVFITDGQQTPPLPQRPVFQGKPGAVKGWLVGVGGLGPAPIPRMDMDNRSIGFWKKSDIAMTRVGDAGASGANTGASRRADQDRELYLSSLDETELKALAGITGLRYHRLERPGALSAALRAPEFGQMRPVAADLRWVLATWALAAVLVPYLPSPRASSKRG